MILEDSGRHVKYLSFVFTKQVVVIAPVPAIDGIILLGQKEINYSFRAGMVLLFFLTANPTRRIRAKGDKITNQGQCRVPLIDEDEIRDWLSQKFADASQLHEVVIAGKNNLFFRKKDRP